MKKIFALAMSGCAMAFAGGAQASMFTFDGNIAYHSDVVQIGFALNNDATNVRVWTDSYMNAINFDPITSLWRADGSLIARNDDAPGIAPGQTRYDSGFSLASLAAGSYYFTIAAYNNWNNGNNLSDGFNFDSQTPIALANWCEPASHCNMGSYWRVHLDGVDSAQVTPVPLPAAAWLFGTGLIGVFGMRKAKSSAA